MLYIKLIGIGLVITILGYFIYEYNHMKEELITKDALISTLGSEIAVQNAAILNMKTVSDKREETGKTIVQEAHVIAKIQVQKAQVIYEATPSIPSDDCKSALALGNVK